MAGALLSPGCIGAPISLTARSTSSSRVRVSKHCFTVGVSGAPPPRMASSAADTAAGSLPSDDTLVQYVVLRRDLIETWPLGSVVTQGCHASVAAIWSHKDDPHTLDYCSPANLDRMHKVTLEVKGETQIVNLSEKLAAGGVAHKLWIEQPENIPTCLATKPYPKSAVSSFFKKLKLCNSLMEGSASQFVTPEQMYIDEKTLIFPRKSKNLQQCDSLASKAKWDYQHTRILLQLMASLIEDGYRRGIHLSPIGYAKLVEEFNRKTGKSLELSQLKSQIEKLRRDWKAWLSIKNPRSTCAGMSWNSNKGTWDAPEEWWTSMAELNPNVVKFKERGLEHEDLMIQIFHGTTVTGEMHWTPSPAQGNAHFVHHANNSYNDGENVGSGPTSLALPSSRPNINLDDPNLGSQKRRRAEEDVSEDENSSGRERQSTGARLGRMLEHMADVVEKTGNQLHIVYNAPGCGIGDCIAKLTTLEGVKLMDPLYFFAIDLFSTPVHREIFIGLPTDEARLGWLEYQKTKHSRMQGQLASTFQCPPPAPSNSPPPPYYPQHPTQDSVCNQNPPINHL